MFGNNPYWDNYNGNGHGHPPYNNHDYQGYHQPQQHHNYEPMYHGGYPGQPAYGYPSTSHGLVSLEPPPPPPIPPMATSTPKKKNKKAKTHAEGRQLSTLKFGGKFKKVDPNAVKATKEKFAKAVGRVARMKGVNPYQWKPAQPPVVQEKRVEENTYYMNPAFQSASVVYKQQQQRYGDETEFTAGKQRVVNKERFVELCRLFSSVIGERQRTRFKRLHRHFRARNMFEGVVAAHRVVSAGRPRGKDNRGRRTFPLKSAAGAGAGGGGGDVWDATAAQVQHGQVASSSVPDSPMMTVFASSTRLVRKPRAEVEKAKEKEGEGEEQRNESPTAVAVRETLQGVLTSVTAVEPDKEMSTPAVELAEQPVTVSAASTPAVAMESTPELPVSTSTPVAEEDTPKASASTSTEAVLGEDVQEEERQAVRTVSPVFRDMWDEAMEGEVDVEVIEVKPAMAAAPVPPAPAPTPTPPPVKTYQQLMREKQERQLEATREEMREQMERKAVKWAKEEMEGLHRVYGAGETAVGMPTPMLTKDDVEKKAQERMQPHQVITLDSSNESDGEIEVLEVVPASAARAAAEIVLGEGDGDAAATTGEGEGGEEAEARPVTDKAAVVTTPVVAASEPDNAAQTTPEPQQSLEEEWEENSFDPLLESLEQFGVEERGVEEKEQEGREADERDALYDRGKSWCDATLRATTTATEATLAAAAPVAPVPSLPARGAYSLRVVNGTVITGDSKECYAYAEKKHCPAGMFCRFVHDGSVEHQKEQLCARLLKGLCRPGSSRCGLRHAGLQPHQLPVCQFFLRIECTERDCPLVHVKHGDHVAPCVDFQKGVCMRGIHCDSPHRYVYQTVKQRGVVDDGTTTTTGDEGEAEEADTSTFQFFED